jgi:hypothetical protein
MKTIDMRTEGSRASVSLSVVDEEDEEDEDTEYEEQDSTAASTPSREGDHHQLAASHTSGKPILVRRRSLTDLVAEFAFAMRRSLQWKKQKTKLGHGC